MNEKEPPPPFHSPPDLWEKLKPLARQMRHAPTPAEDRLWQRIRGRRLCGTKFRRQHTIDRFIVDFFCDAAGLIVEVDGAIHEYTAEEDQIRQSFLESQGFKVLRFTNAEIFTSLEAVLEVIAANLSERLPPSKS